MNKDSEKLVKEEFVSEEPKMKSSIQNVISNVLRKPSSTAAPAFGPPRTSGPPPPTAYGSPLAPPTAYGSPPPAPGSASASAFNLFAPPPPRAGPAPVSARSAFAPSPLGAGRALFPTPAPVSATSSVRSAHAETLSSAFSQAALEPQARRRTNLVESPVLVTATTQTRPLDTFILQLNANGSFILDETFVRAAGISNTIQSLLDGMPQELKDAQEYDAEVKLAIWATVIALIVFEQKFTSLKEEWELMSDKSRKFVIGQLKKSKIDITILTTAANTLVKF